MAKLFLKILILVGLCAFVHSYEAAVGEYTFQYSAKIQGLDDFPDLKQDAEELSQLINPDDALLIVSESILRDFLASDISQIKDYLHSHGFYDVKIFPEIEIKDSLRAVTIRVYLGDRYTVNNINVFVNDEARKVSTSVLRRGDPAVNEQILKGKVSIAQQFKETGHPFVEVLEERVEINNEALFVNINYYFNIKPPGAFGDSTIMGAKTVNVDYIKRFVQWNVGDSYDVRKIKATEKLLMETNLFDAVLIAPQAADKQGLFPIKISLHERTHHNFNVNLYVDAALSTGDKQSYELGVIPKYSYNNLFGNNEHFEANTVLSYSTQDLNVSLKKPHLLLFGLSGRAFASAERRDHVPYFRSGLDLGVDWQYKFIDTASASLGLGYENYSLTKKTDDTNSSYNFVSIPLGFHWEWLDDKVFSTSGLKTSVSWEPYLNSDYSLYKSNVSLAAYVPVFSRNISLAFWGKWSALLGADFKSAPIDKRVYLGGEQNLRGYSKDSLGDVSSLKSSPEEKIPDGGLSSVSGGVEARFIIFGNFGLGVFANAGQISKAVNVFENIKSLDDLYLDAGVSLFYFLPNIGPIRIDAAHPIGNNIPKDENNFKLNLTFGQAF